MSPRPRVTSSKRQKELARKEKQQAKAQRKLQRKAESLAATGRPDFEAADVDEAAETDSQVEASNSQAAVDLVQKEHQ